MKDAGFFTVSSVLMHTKKALCEIKGLSEPKIDKIRDAAIKMSGASFITGTEARQRRMNIINITTGSDALNDILGGGIESGSITEVYGKTKRPFFILLSTTDFYPHSHVGTFVITLNNPR